MNLRHLGAVVAIAETGSLSRAAREINLTQPAVTQAVARLETLLGLRLFERQPGGMVATDAAQILVPRVQAALRFIDNSRVTAAQMHAFIALSRKGSYAGAAAETGLREPSIHRAVGDLSLALGVRLVERRGRRVILTQRGLAVARRFRLAAVELRAGLAELTMLEGRETGRISIGAMPLSRARLLPNAVAAFHRAYPDADILIAEGAQADLIGPLLDGDIDLMVGALRNASPAEGVMQHPLFVDRPVIIGSGKHPLAHRHSPPTVQQLAGYAWIVPPQGTPLRRQWRRIFETEGVEPPRIAIECASVILIRQMLIQSEFLTLLSPDQVAVELEAEWLARIGAAPGDPSRTIGFTTRADWRPTPLQSAFITAMKAEAESMPDIRT